MTELGLKNNMLQMRSIRFLLSVATVAATVSCMEEQAQPQVELTGKTFIGHIEENPDTKTSLNEDFSICWNEDDHITVFSKEGAGTAFEDVTVLNDGKTSRWLMLIMPYIRNRRMQYTPLTGKRSLQLCLSYRLQ